MVVPGCAVAHGSKRPGSAARRSSRAAARRAAAPCPRSPAAAARRAARHRREQAACVRMHRVAKSSRTGPSSTIRPAYITATRSAISATTPKSCVMSSSARPNRALQLAQQVEDLRLDGDVERRRRLVGDHERRIAGERDGDHRPLPHAAGQLMRIVADARRRLGNAAPPRAARSPARARLAASRGRGRSAPRRSGRRRVKTGLSAVIGSWKISADRAPRTSRISRSDSAQQVACPRRRSARAAIRPGGCTSRRIENAVTDLPLPDSPTRPSVSPGREWKLTSINGRHDRPADRRPSSGARTSSSSGPSDIDFLVLAEHRAQRVGDLADAWRCASTAR